MSDTWFLTPTRVNTNKFNDVYTHRHALVIQLPLSDMDLQIATRPSSEDVVVTFHLSIPGNLLVVTALPAFLDLAYMRKFSPR